MSGKRTGYHSKLSSKNWRMAYVWWKKSKRTGRGTSGITEKQNRLQERISNIAKAKDSAEETVVQMTISKTELDETLRQFQRNWNC